jgi:hypothetical protein
LRSKHFNNNNNKKEHKTASQIKVQLRKKIKFISFFFLFKRVLLFIRHLEFWMHTLSFTLIGFLIFIPTIFLFFFFHRNSSYFFNDKKMNSFYEIGSKKTIVVKRRDKQSFSHFIEFYYLWKHLLIFIFCLCPRVYPFRLDFGITSKSIQQQHWKVKRKNYDLVLATLHFIN